MRLAAATPSEWFATHLYRFQHRYDEPDIDESARRWYEASAAHGESEAMRTLHAQYVDEGATPQAATKWVVTEHVGSFASAAGFLYALGGAAVLDVDRVRFGTHPEGWVQLVDLGEPRVAVVTGHPWSDLPGVEIVPDVNALAALVVASIRRLGDPIVAAGRRLGRVGATSLWAEIADALGIGPIYDPHRPADPQLLPELDLALRSPGAPWRQVPDLWTVQRDGEPVVLARKAGCCLAYQSEDTHEPEEPDAFTLAWEQAFPTAPGEQSYCSTCCFRDLDDCAARLLWEHDWERRTAAQTPAS